MHVMKFGGTSLGNAERIRNVARIVEDSRRERPIVVVSAVAGVTDTLLSLLGKKSQSARLRTYEKIAKLHRKIASELGLDEGLLDGTLRDLRFLAAKGASGAKRRDLLLSFGERLCAPLVSGVLREGGVPSEAFPAWELGMITDDAFGKAEPLGNAPQLLRKKINALTVIPVITGYIGRTRKGDITTLGRGGSDYTAAIIGAALSAEKIQIWKEVDGILTADPRLVPEAQIVPELAFEEASELAYFGAKVLHPKAILPAMKAGVPVEVVNTFAPKKAGTTIVSNFRERKQKIRTVEALTFKRNIAAIHIYSPEFFDGNILMSRIFEIFERHHTVVDVITTSIASVSLTVNSGENLSALAKHLEEIGTVAVEHGKAIVCAVGGGVNAAGVAGVMFTALGNAGIPVEMISQAASGVSMTFVVEEKDAEEALKVLHKEYIEHV